MSDLPTVLLRIDPSRNMFRRYELSVEPALFGMALVRQFGRIGTRGRCLSHLFETTDLADAARAKLLRQKLRRGYQHR